MNATLATSPREVSLRDPLSELARKERRSLLVASTIGVIFVEGGLVPSKIAAFGIEFTHADQRTLLMVVGAVVLYQLVGFVIYASADFIRLRMAYVDAFKPPLNDDEAKTPRKSISEILDEISDEEYPFAEFDRSQRAARVESWSKAMDRNMTAIRLQPAVSNSRLAFEFILPIVVAVYSMWVLWGGKGVFPHG
jgi:hypothetical protein